MSPRHHEIGKILGCRRDKLKNAPITGVSLKGATEVTNPCYVTDTLRYRRKHKKVIKCQEINAREAPRVFFL